MDFIKRLFGFKSKNFKSQLPQYWTETKISEDTYQVNIPKNKIDQWNSERHERDKVEILIKTNGFYNKPSGRSGTIYYVNKGKLCEIYVEISGISNYDILINFDNLKEWVLPFKKLITSAEKIVIKKRLKFWLAKENIKASL